MKNALMYAVNYDSENHKYVDQMVNSINSFYANNSKKLLKTMHVYIMVDDASAPFDLSKMNPDVRFTLVDELSYDYKPIKMFLKRITHHTYFRWEMFVNPLFKDVDNMVYIDCDTEVVAPVDELFHNGKSPTVSLAEEKFNHLWLNHRFITNHYYNCGVMATNPKAMISSGIGKKLIDASFETANRLLLRYADQDAMNMTLNKPEFKDIVHVMGAEYNSFPGTWPDKDPPDNEKIVHHAGSSKRKMYELNYI